MNLPILFSQLDANVIAITGVFIGVWLTVHFSLFEATGNLNTIRNRAICEIASNETDTELIKFIDKLRSNSYVLVLEPKKKSRNLKISLWLFFSIAIFTICHKPISSNMILWPDANYFYFFYIFSLGAASNNLWTETKYYREFRQLERQYQSCTVKQEQVHITLKT